MFMGVDLRGDLRGDLGGDLGDWGGGGGGWLEDDFFWGWGCGVIWGVMLKVN
jgi:hypothetical protein